MSDPGEPRSDARHDGEGGEGLPPVQPIQPVIPGRPGRAPARPVLIVAAAAAALILTVGAGIGGWFLMRDASEKGSASDPQERDVAVFFCAASSSNPDCGHRDAEQAQKDAVRKRLLEMNGVMTVKYESKEQAYENFKKTFADRKDLLDGASPGDIPDSFRVHVTGIGVAKAVKSQFEGTPGVDTVVISTLGRA